MKKLCIVRRAAGFVVLAGLLLLSCNLEGGGDEKLPGSGTPESGGVDTSGVDWTSYNAADDYAFKINNHSNKNLVVFKNDVRKENIVGGVAANHEGHGIKASSAYFGTTSSFTLIFVTREDFEANKGSTSALQALKQTPFTRLFAFYNKSGSNDIPFEVSGKLGGNNKLIINNDTSYDLELRLDAARGTPLGYAPYEALNTKLSMANDDYNLFPVFTKYNPVRDELIRMYPRTPTSKKPISLPLAFSDGDGDLTITASSYLGTGTDFSTGAAYLVVTNSSDVGIEIGTATKRLTTETGNKIINPGTKRTFVFLSDKTDGSYEQFQSFSGYSIFSGMYDPVAIPAITSDDGKMEVDYRYYVTVTGKFTQDTASAAIEKSRGKLTLTTMGGDE